MKVKAIILAAVMILTCLSVMASCEKAEEGEAVTLSFKQAASYADLKKLDGKRVEINGYIATSSPADGSFMFLMNLPYQSCPFCVPNTSQLSNTMEVYPKDGKTFEYTSQAIKVKGKLEVSDSEKKSFTDKYGYEFNYKIVEAEYEIIKESDLSPKLAIWQKVAESDIINDLYSMYDYVNFVCAWPTYFVNSYTDEEGNEFPGYFLNADDTRNYLTIEGAQWNYGYAEGYFDSLISKVEGIDKNEFGDLVENIRKAEALAADAINELMTEQYTSEYQYVEKFGTNDYIFTLNRGEELANKFDEVYGEFASWLGEWEL